MHKRCAYRLFLVLLFLGGVWACRGPGTADQERGNAPEEASLSSHVSRAVATPADPIRFEIRLETDPALRLAIPQIGDRIQGFRIVGEGNEGPKRVGGRLISKRWYDLRADIVGSYLLPGVDISYEAKDGKKTLKTPQIFVEVKSDAQEGEARQEGLRDIKPLVERGLPLGQKLLWIFLPLLILAALAAAVFFAKRWSGQTQETEEILPPDQWAMNELQEFKRRFQNLDIGNLEQRKKYYFRLSEIYREYLERRFAFPAIDLTTEEILPRVKKEKGFSSESYSMAQAFFQGTDFVKFTDLLPDSKDPERLWQLAVDFVSRTRPAPAVLLESVSEEPRKARVSGLRGRR